MKRACLFLLIAVLAATMFTGCDESTTVDSRATGEGYNGKVVGTVHGVVTTRDTNSPMANVRVAYITEGATREVRTDAHGLYRLDGLREGTYQISFLSPDTNYADWLLSVDVYEDSAYAHPSDVDYHVVIQRGVTLFRRNAGVSGYVFAQLDNENIYAASGATVRAVYSNGILNASYSTTADSNGFYTFSTLPASPMTLVVMPWTNADDVSFGASALPVTLPDAGGMLNAPSIVLSRAVAGVVMLRNNFANGDFPVNDNLSLLFNKALEDSSLRITLTRGAVTIPVQHTLDATGMQLTIDPVIELMANTTYSLTILGRTSDYASFSFGPLGFSTERNITLDYTNAWPADGAGERVDVGVTDTLVFVFSKPVDTTNPNGRVWVSHASDTLQHVLITTIFSADNKTLQVVPVGQYLPLTRYSVNFSLYSAIATDLISFSRTFQTEDALAVPGIVQGLASDTSNHVDWASRTLRLNWSGMAGVTHYEVYAWNDLAVNEHVRVAIANATSQWATETALFVLPDAFDWLPDDGITTPFAHGIHTKFAVRGINSAGEGPFSAELSLRDVISPRIAGLVQDASANNTGGTTTRVVTCHFSSLVEYCDGAVAPVFGFTEAGGSPGYVLPASAASWQWDTGARSGILTITVPIDRNGAGDRLWMTHFSDNSGNVLTDSVRLTLF